MANDLNSSPLQSNFEDNQIYDLDVDKMYSDYIGSIDQKRSHVNVIKQNTSALLQAIRGDPNAPSTNNLMPAKTVQESRCHAFYRMIGFPVVDKNKNFYNPGHDIVYAKNRAITLDTKIRIAQNQDSKFIALSNFREQYYLKYLQIFSNPTSIDAGVLSLSGGANPAGKRLFQSPFLHTSDPFDTDYNNQSYPGVYDSIVGGGSEGDGGSGHVSLSEYQDSSGNFPQASTLPPNKYHIINPFIVDPRIDFTCSPKYQKANRVAIPFVPNTSYLQVSSTVYADPPLIEMVIKDRFSVTNQIQNSGDLTQSFATLIKNISNAPPNQTVLGQIIQNDIKQLSSNSQFITYFNIIQAMIKKLVEAQNIIALAQAQYYWVPVPSLIGPEGGCTTQGIFLPNKMNKQLVTSADGAILLSTAQSIFAPTNQNPQASAAKGVPDVGGLNRAVKNTLTPANSPAFINNSMNTTDLLNTRRTATLDKAAAALRTVEIIMGEFSGLGLCDIFAVVGALYTMPQNDLLGFLDTDALARMNAYFNSNYSYPNGITGALTSFVNTVKQFYQLMDALYQNEAHTQGLSV
jgi:hypothetical protein